MADASAMPFAFRMHVVMPPKLRLLNVIRESLCFATLAEARIDATTCPVTAFLDHTG